MIADRYRTIIKIIEEGSLSSAADKLGYTPSGISRLVASFEDELGFKLFTRSKNGIELTRECEVMLPTFREIAFNMSQCEQLAAQVRGVEIGTITIGTSYGFYYRWLAGIISAFKKEHPDIEIKLVHRNSSMLMEALSNHEIDLGIVSKREGDARWMNLISDPLYAWLPRDHELTALSSVPMDAFRTEPYIEPHPGEDTDSSRAFRAYDIKPKIAYSVDNTYAVYCLVDAGLGISLMNNLSMRSWGGNVVTRPVDPPQNIEIGMILPTEDNTSPAAAMFIDYMTAKTKRIHR